MWTLIFVSCIIGYIFLLELYVRTLSIASDVVIILCAQEANLNKFIMQGAHDNITCNNW